MKAILIKIILALTAIAAATPPAAASRDPATGGPGRTPLMTAVVQEDTAAVERLLAAGARADGIDDLSRTALHLAVTGALAITERLIAAGANVDARDAGGISVLMRAAGEGRSLLVDRLLEAGARLDFKDYQCRTAADWAGRRGHGELARRLAVPTGPEAAPTTPAGPYDFAEDVFADVSFPEWFKTSFLDLDVDLQEALDAGKQGILVFISTRRCSYCKAFFDKSLHQPDIRRRVAHNFDVIGLEIFDDTMMTAVDGTRYRVKEFVTVMKASLTPTLIFYGEGGTQLLRIVGYYPPDRFRRVLDYLEGGHYGETSLRDFMATSPAGPDGLPQDELFADPPHILDRRAMASDRPLMVVFEEPACEPCARFHRRVLADPSIRRLLEAYEVRRLNIADPGVRVITPTGERTDAPGWYRDLGLAYTPAVVLFDNAGREAMRIDSETLRYRMEGSLQLVLGNAHHDDAQLQRWRRARAIEASQAQEPRGNPDKSSLP